MRSLHLEIKGQGGWLRCAAVGLVGLYFSDGERTVFNNKILNDKHSLLKIRWAILRKKKSILAHHDM